MQSFFYFLPMSDINSIKEPVNRELKEFDNFFSDELSTSSHLLNIITRHILKQKGKKLRPILVFLSSKLINEPNKSTHSAALLIELMHTATLVHDDVVDIAYKRRSFFSINALWKNKTAVLIGDFFLAKGLLHAINKKEFQLLEIVSDAVKEMSEGELLQIEKARLLNIDREVYFQIITKKTATLIAASVIAGAASASASENQLARLKELGLAIGIAFQIKDDIFDFQGSAKTIGKPVGNDIKEQKMTLPLIYLIENSTNEEKKEIYRVIKKYHNKPDKVKWLVNEVVKSGGIEHATMIMNQYRDKALAILDEFNQSPAYGAMKELIFYITEREK